MRNSIKLIGVLAGSLIAGNQLAQAGYSVSGNTISWDNDGWYQVQNPSKSLWDVCNSSNDGRSCTVPNGTYRVINHSINKPWEPVIVPSGGGGGGGGGGSSCPNGRYDWSGSWAEGFYCPVGNDAQVRRYLPSNWRGWGKLRVGSIGRNFSIDWDNNGSSSGHSEFDISVSRDVNVASNLGYGQTRLRNISRNMSMTARGRWTKAPSGKTHIQAIIWLSKNRGRDANAGSRETIDITVAEWMTYEQMNQYRNGQIRPYVHLHTTSYTIQGSTYSVYRRVPGGINEKATYMIVRNQRRDWTSGSRSTRVNPKVFTDLIRSIEPNDKFDNNWYISALGWEITGASNPDSKGKFEFYCYSIPRLNGSASGNGFNTCW